LDSSQIDRYLARIDADRPDRPDLGGLRSLQAAHLARVPFENLSIHLGEPIVLTEDALFDKIVGHRRGGFCYELNGAFSALLRGLGYQVDLLSARVYGDGRFGPPLDHMALRVHLDEPWLVDVGFGRFSDAPLRLSERGDQVDPGGVFRIEDAGGDLTVLTGGAPQYRLDPRPYALEDFAPTCWWQSTSPDSHFTHSLTCSLPSPGGRVTLSGDRLIRTTGGERVERTLGSEAEILEAYQKLFGIELDRAPRVRAA
jgi:N-hydroxyarylamine O-acetyltransferase